MTTQSTTQPRRLIHHAPFAGSILEGDKAVPLAVRFDRVGVSADGRLIAIDRPTEWLDDLFHSWYAYDLDGMGPDQMASACTLVESMLDLRPGTLSAESLRPALLVAAACVGGTLIQLRRTLGAA